MPSNGLKKQFSLEYILFGNMSQIKKLNNLDVLSLVDDYLPVLHYRAKSTTTKTRKSSIYTRKTPSQNPQPSQPGKRGFPFLELYRNNLHYLNKIIIRNSLKKEMKFPTKKGNQRIKIKYPNIVQNIK